MISWLINYNINTTNKLETMKIIRLLVSILFFLTGTIFILGQLEEWTLVTFTTKVLMGCLLLYIGIMIFPLKLPFTKRQEQIAETIIGIFLIGIVIFVLIMLFITLI